MKNTIYFLLFAVLSPLWAFSSPLWQRKIINYERNQYKAGFQNWMIDQSGKGWIYCANSRGLLEFDGINWEIYNVPNNIVRSLKIIDDVIYVGGSTEFGYFAPDYTGLLVYRSLSERINNWDGEVWNIMAHENYICFLSEYYIHMYHRTEKNIITLPVKVKIDCSASIDGVLYIGTSEGIFYLDKEKTLAFLSCSESLKGRKLVSLLPYEGKILVTTARSGLYIIGKSGMDKIQSAADDFIKNNQLFCTSVSGSRIVLGSVQNGIFIFNPADPSYKEAFHLNNGLKNNTVLSSFFDKDQNLWLGLDKGLDYIDLNSLVRPLFSTVSPIGTGYCSLIYNKELYLGTNQALYKIDKNGKYNLIEGSEGQIWSLNIIDNTLFGSGDNGITIVTPSETYIINLPGVWETQSLTGNKEKLIAGTYSGLYILQKKNGRWTFSHKVPEFNSSCRGFIEDEEPYTFWTTNTTHGIQKISFDPEFTQLLSRKTYSLETSAFHANTLFRKIDNNLVVCMNDGLFRYSRITDNFERYTQLESMLDGAKYYEYLFVDKLKNIWFVSDKQLKLLEYTNGEYKKNSYNLGLTDELIDSYENVFLPDSGSAIVSVDNGFVKINLSRKEDSASPITVFIRKLISSKNDSIVNYGLADKVVELSYSDNSVGIHFAATDYSRSSDILYTYRLKGLDETWSIPSTNTMKEYTNLREGKYIFEVKAFINEKISGSDTASLSFTIFPPWYRSWWAYTGYFIAFSVVLFILYRRTIGKQKKIILQKKEELITQTQKYEEETKLKDREIYKLQNENLKNELNYKTQELNGHILNIIRKNEMLEEVKKDALGISKAIDEEKPITVLRRKVMSLVGRINNNIEHDTDFKIFQSNFDIIHGDFFKLLDEKFPGLSRNDKLLCAYLKMNLFSKEIAPLMNISVRGVEVNRYRLRKKMNLDRDINLSEYLNNLKDNSI